MGDDTNGARDAAKDVIDKDSATDSGARPGKGAQRPKTGALGRIVPASPRGKLLVGLGAGVVAAVVTFLVVGADTTSTGAAAGLPNCDCPHVDAGLLTQEFQKQCVDRETQLKQLAADHKLNLAADADHKLVSGEFCDSVAAGPDAWPVSGGPETPPRSPPSGTVCTTVSGIIRNCGK